MNFPFQTSIETSFFSRLWIRAFRRCFLCFFRCHCSDILMPQKYSFFSFENWQKKEKGVSSKYTFFDYKEMTGNGYKILVASKLPATVPCHNRAKRK